MKILILDDSKAMRMIVKRTLRMAGYEKAEIIEGANGMEGLKLIEAESPDLILSDWNMPEMTGYELLQELKQKDYDIPFGFVTSEGSLEMRKLAHEAGALFLIAKPFNAETFQQALSMVTV